MTTKCAGIKRDGARCSATVPEDNLFCHRHDPERGEERRESASKAGEAGGRGRGGSASKVAEVERIRRDLRGVVNAVVSEKLSARQADAITKALAGELRAVELSRKLHDDVEFDERLSELEDRIFG
jgi:hypothetical protein